MTELDPERDLQGRDLPEPDDDGEGLVDDDDSPAHFGDTAELEGHVDDPSDEDIQRDWDEETYHPGPSEATEILEDKDTEPRGFEHG